jgi:hypothetical protein
MMFAKVVALTLIPAGAAALGAVTYIQQKPRAFTSETHVAAEPSRVMPLSAQSPAVEPIVEEVQPVVLEPMVVAKPVPVKPRAQKMVKRKVPCSAWRDLGYQHVDNGNASGVSRVRELCDPE